MAAGRIEILTGFDSPQEGVSRTLRIYLPDAVHRSGAHRFPVLVMHDAQNLFDHPASAIPTSWGVNTAFDQLIAHGEIEPWIVVAVDHRGVDRIADYTPYPHPSWPSEARGATYAAFLVQTLLPWAARHLPISTERRLTGIAGSSMGGLMSLYAGRTYPQVFGRIAALSPTVMASGYRLAQAWTSRAREPQRIYLDAGAHERFDALDQVFDYGRDTAAFHHHLVTLGYGPDALKLLLEPGGTHDEPSWRRRFPDAIRWLSKG